MPYVTQAICGTVSHGPETSSDSLWSYWGSKSPKLALGLLLGAEELQSFHCIGRSPWTSRRLLGQVRGWHV